LLAEHAPHVSGAASVPRNASLSASSGTRLLATMFAGHRTLRHVAPLVKSSFS
jgi:hypothetical protein